MSVNAKHGLQAGICSRPKGRTLSYGVNNLIRLATPFHRTRPIFASDFQNEATVLPVHGQDQWMDRSSGAEISEAIGGKRSSGSHKRRHDRLPAIPPVARHGHHSRDPTTQTVSDFQSFAGR